MKRFILISMIILGAAGAWAQTNPTLSTFQTGFTAFSADMAGTLSYNATVGNDWSDAYIGGFPHFGVGLALGVTMVPASSLEPLFTAMDVKLPDALVTYGLPIPAAALSAKLGGLILPFDVGLKAMVLPQDLTASLLASGITADYTLIGGNVRYAILKEGLLLPDVSIGAGYNRLSGSIGMELQTETPSFTFNDGASNHTVAATKPALSLAWKTNSFDFTLQVSKTLLFIKPFAGIGYSLGDSTVSGGLASTVTYDGVAITPAQLAAINDALTEAGQAEAKITAEGILFGASDSTPVFRVYGGVSLAFLFLNLDVSATYVPINKSLGASAMIRVQL